MTPKQRTFATELLIERDLPEDGPFATELDALKVGEPAELDVARASELLTYLLSLPRVWRTTRSVRPGVYRSSAGLVRVRQVFGARDVLAQRLVASAWLDSGHVELEPRSRLSAADAHQFVQAEGRCPWCLTRVEAGHTNRLQDLSVRCARKFIN